MVWAGANGEALTIKGINWFGFETDSTMVDGLWQGPNAITQNFEAIVWRIKLLGFNTVRLPFSFQASPRQDRLLAHSLWVSAML